MSGWFVGEIRLFPYTIQPDGWLLCNGQELPINDDYAQLHNAIGNIYGGNGTTSFCLPNLNGRVIVGSGAATWGETMTVGKTGGETTVSLTGSEAVGHTHGLNAVAASATTTTPAGNLLAMPVAPSGQNGLPAAPATFIPASAGPTLAPMDPASIASAGGGAPHENTQPFMCLAYFIATTGTAPGTN